MQNVDFLLIKVWNGFYLYGFASLLFWFLPYFELEKWKILKSKLRYISFSHSTSSGEDASGSWFGSKDDSDERSCDPSWKDVLNQNKDK